MDNDKSNFEEEGQLVIDIYQTPEKFVIEAPIAGVKPEDIDVDVKRDSISIKGTRIHEQSIKEEDYIYQECYWGNFSRSIILPQEIDPEKAKVEFKNGILIVNLPKAQNLDSARKLKIKIE
jgi:HSP20 family protein